MKDGITIDFTDRTICVCVSVSVCVSVCLLKGIGSRNYEN